MTRKYGLVGAVAFGLIASVAAVGVVTAADHIDAPATMADSAADITDFYAWHTDGGKIIAAINFAGLGEKGIPATYDDTVVYGIHIDNDGDQVADEDVWIRFGKNSADEWGVQVTGLPGVADPVVGPVDTVIDGPLGNRVFAGLRDDSFFFDLQGFLDTLMTGTLSFDSTRDFFKGTNVTSIVVEISTDAAAGGNTNIEMWATTRK